MLAKASCFTVMFAEKMKSLRALLAALFTTAAMAESPPNPSSKPQAEIMRELRLQWLTRKPTPENATTNQNDVVAVLMDWPLGEQTVTILASSEGDASVYTTGTNGIMGGIGHDNARKAAFSFIQCAKKHLSLSSLTTDFSYPDRIHIRFFFVTYSGVRSVTFTATDIEKKGTDAYDLYAQGQQVLTEMRLITEKQRGN